MNKFDEHNSFCDCDKYTICDEIMYKLDELSDDFRLFMYVAIISLWLILILAAS